MSDLIKHECGIAFIRLRKPLEYYYEKYKTSFYGLKKLYLLMEKQHNRGQDGVGVANLKLNIESGLNYFSIERSVDLQPIQNVFKKIKSSFKNIDKRELSNPNQLKKDYNFTGEIFLGHLRYGTFGKNDIHSCHPFLRENNWKSRNLLVAGNFNLTNVDELFQLMIENGQHPREKKDVVTIMERIGYFLDLQNQQLFEEFHAKGYSNKDITKLITYNLNIESILKKSTVEWDGGYVIIGILGHGDTFILRDSNGIRPCYYYIDDEIIVATSEKSTIKTVFNSEYSEIKELTPGHALITRLNGTYKEVRILPEKEKKSCSFERIYFSRGSDQEIYNERKKLGENIAIEVFKEINNDFENSIFSYIPNTAEVSFLGMIKKAELLLDENKKKQILNLKNNISEKEIQKILSLKIRIEKTAIKDTELRTFIAEDSTRDDLVEHAYDITYYSDNKEKDNIIIIDDSIVRGTTLNKSIIKIFSRYKAKKIIIVSSAPQIRYPDCYGIDMAKLEDFIAFQAAIHLLKEHNKEHIIDEVYKKCKEQINLPLQQQKNYVKEIYNEFTYKQISDKITRLLKPAKFSSELQIIYQTLDGLKKSCPNHTGDWYFSGNYPTPGGNKVVTKSFINYIEKNNQRSY